MAQKRATVRRLPTREEAETRKRTAGVLQQLQLVPGQDVECWNAKARRSIADLKEALSFEVRDPHDSLWPGGFDMVSRRQVEYVRKELRKLEGKDRPQDVTQAFLLLLGNIEPDSGEILLTRQQFADELGILPRHVSSVMTTLERIGVVWREYSGRGVTYYVNANVIWNGSNELRKAAAAKVVEPARRSVHDEPKRGSPPLLKLMKNGVE